jgi:ABC-type branched-subunit amino acid transport system substrate-binding protein
LAALFLLAALAACGSGISSQSAATKPPPTAADQNAPPEPAPAPIAPVTQETPAAAATPPASTRTYGTAAILLPMTGPAASTAAALFNAAQLALFEVADKSFTLVPYDTKGTPEGAAAAAQQAVANTPDIILGPLFATEVTAAAPLARQAHIPIITFSADRTVAGAGVYVMGFLPGAQGLRVAAYAARHGKPRLAILAPSNDYGQRVAQEVANGSGSLGILLAGTQYYDEASLDLTAPIRRLMKASTNGDVGFDAVLLPDEGQRLRSVASSLALNGIDLTRVKLLGTMLWSDSNPSAEPALLGGWYPMPATAAHADFNKRYAKTFGAQPPRIASLGYDAMALAAVLARKTPRDFSDNALTNQSGFAGVDGLFRLLPDGTAERGYAIDEVGTNGTVQEVDPAPTSFGGPGT